MEALIIPIRLEENLDSGKTTIIPESTEDISIDFKDLGLKESALEEFVRKKIGLVFPYEEQDLLIIGQQIKNKEEGRSDLVALDGDGSIVLIELKRDEADMVRREEAFEFQAIRYASNYALIKTPAEVVEKLFTHYVHKHRSEFNEPESWTDKMIAEKRLADFLRKTNADKSFNNQQRIILIASSFDPQTISACAWLAKKVDLSCVIIRPMEYKDQNFLKIQQIIPVTSDDELFVGIDASSKPEKTIKTTGEAITRAKLPRMPWLFEKGLLKKGDHLVLRGQDAEPAEVIDEKQVRFKGELMTYNEWGQKVTGWSAICIYIWACPNGSQKTLDDLRREKMAESL